MGNRLLVKSFKISFMCGIPFRKLSLSTVYEKNYFGREAKMLGKLLSPTRKKRKLIFDDVSTPSAKGPKFNHLSGGKESTRRIAVLNSLFIKHISDLLMTGSVSANVLDRGLEITRVSVAPTFAEVYVYWSANSEENISSLEQVLPSIGFELRHELSQLGVMGHVPRIEFIKDKHISSAMRVDYLLSIADYGEDHVSPPLGSEFKDSSLPLTQVVKVKSASSDSEEDVSPEEVEICEEETIPVMRQDIFNLDHKAIMDRLLKSMTKSRALHRFHPNLALDCKGEELPSSRELTAEYMDMNERKEAMNRFILTRKIQRQKRIQNKYEPDLHPRKYDESGRTDDGSEYLDDFEDEDFPEEDDYIEDHRKY